MLGGGGGAAVLHNFNCNDKSIADAPHAWEAIVRPLAGRGGCLKRIAPPSLWLPSGGG